MYFGKKVIEVDTITGKRQTPTYRYKSKYIIILYFIKFIMWKYDHSKPLSM